MKCGKVTICLEKVEIGKGLSDFGNRLKIPRSTRAYRFDPGPRHWNFSYSAFMPDLSSADVDAPPGQRLPSSHPH
jgi:hypothetical protein